MSYSSAIFMDLSTHALVNADCTPFKPTQPSHFNDLYAYQSQRLHGGQSASSMPEEDLSEGSEMVTEHRHNHFSKYRGAPLAEDLSIETFQQFKTEWIAYLQMCP